jgi:hypothetical protein
LILFCLSQHLTATKQSKDGRTNLHTLTNGSSQETEGVCVGEGLCPSRRWSGQCWCDGRIVRPCEWPPPTPSRVSDTHHGAAVGYGKQIERDLHLPYLSWPHNKGYISLDSVWTHPL